MNPRARTIGLLTFALGGFGTFPDEAAAVDAFDFNGSITDVGVQRGPGQVGGVEFRIRGRFVPEQALDLSRATVVLEDLFVDDAPDGLGELMTTVDDAAVVPLALVARDSNRFDNAVFDQPQSYRPHIRLQIQNRNGAYEFRLKLDRGLMRRRPRVCEENVDASALPITPITHGMRIDDGTNPAVELLTTQPWQCTKPGRYHMRSVGSGGQGTPPPSPGATRTPGPGPTATVSPPPLPTPTPVGTPPPQPGNQPPTASLRQNRVSSNTGEVELDGGDSSDRDGQVVRYRFESGDGRVQDGPSPTARFVYAPGDYRAALVVFDDRGAASQPTTRGFSVKP
jgi:hypothetical protein